MSPVDAKLLVVSNPEDRSELDGLLSDAGFGEVHYGSGGDGVLGQCRELGPDVVILCAGLDVGDARSLAAALRQEAPGTSIVLVGQDTGPIRNALDATDFDVDQFIVRPISSKALVYAVRSGVKARRQRGEAAEMPSADEPQPASPLSDDEIESRARTQSLIGQATNQAIDAFLSEAIAALPGTDAGNDDRRASTAIPVAAHDEPTGKLSHTSALSAAEIADTVGSADTAAAPGWREQTVVLSHAPPPAAPPRPARRTEPPDSAPVGSGFARELRRKMSQMAERLFPGESNRDDAVHTVAHGANTEIDLTDLTDLSGPSGPSPAAFADSLDHELDDEDTSGYETSVTGDYYSDGSGTTPRVRSGLRPKGQVRGSIRDPGNDVASLLSRLFDLGVTGRITFRYGESEKVVYLDRGRPVFATSNLPHDRMGDMLFREGKLTRVQHIRSRELVSESGRRMGEVLVAEGFLKPKELMPAVRRHLEEVVYSLFGWTDGEFEIVEEMLPSSEQIRLDRHPAALTVEGIRRKYDLPRLLELMGSEDPVLALTEAERAGALAQQIELLPAEERAIGLFDGHTPMRAIARDARADTLTVAQAAFALVALGAAEVIGEEPTDTSVTTEAPAAGDERDADIDRERIRAKFDQVVESDYFHLLGVRRDATGFEIRRAYERAARDFDAQSFSDAIRAELGTELGEIQQVLAEAYAVLSDARIRESYRAHLRS